MINFGLLVYRSNNHPKINSIKKKKKKKDIKEEKMTKSVSS